MSGARQALRLRAEVRGEVPRHRDGHGRRPRQADAPADRDPAQAADRGRAARRCSTMSSTGFAAAGVQQGRGQRPLSRRLAGSASGAHGSTALKSSFPTSATCCSKPAAAWSAREPLIDCDPFLSLNSDNLWVDGPADTLKLLASHWDGERMDALLLLVAAVERAQSRRAWAISTWTGQGRLRRRGRSARRAVRLHRHPDALEAPAARRAGRAVLDQYAVGPGDRRGPLLRRGPPGPVVRRRQPRGDPARPRPCWRMSDRAGAPATGPAVFTIPSHRSFADALVAGLIARFGDGPTGSGARAHPAAQQSRGAHRDRGVRARERRRAGAAAADRRSAIPSSTSGSAARSIRPMRRADPAGGRSARRGCSRWPAWSRGRSAAGRGAAACRRSGADARCAADRGGRAVAAGRSGCGCAGARRPLAAVARPPARDRRAVARACSPTRARSTSPSAATA